MTTTIGYAALERSAPLRPFEFERREPGPHDVVVDITHCGVCHSDIHQVRDEWGGAIFPMVPGHEIVGTVARVGEAVTGFHAGDTAGVGVYVDSCRRCESCRADEGQYCEEGMTPTYNGYERDSRTPTYGGYSQRIVVDDDHVLRIPDGMDRAATAPLLCAGITTYSPIRHFGVRAGDRAAVVGLGGLGHMGLKFLKAMGADVTLLSHSPGKKDDAVRLGADHFVVTDDASLRGLARRFDFILDTVSAAHDYRPYLDTLRRDGAMVLVGLPPESPLDASSLINARRRLAGSMIGSVAETQEMLELCARERITADVELIGIDQINDAFERVLRSDVRYRFVVDMASLDGAGGARG